MSTTEPVAVSLQRELRNIGLTTDAIDAVWPEWWSSDAESSLSATTELRYTVARRLGIKPSTLFEGSPQFVLRDALYKNLGETSELQRAVLSSFGATVAKIALRAVDQPGIPLGLRAEDIRRAVRESSRTVGLGELLSLCWGLGMPVIKNQVHPLKNKHMHAMSVHVNGKYAILLERETRFPAQAAFIIAHELGHIFLKHLRGATAYLDVGNPLTARDPDREERDADRFALTLLTGRDDIEFLPTIEDFNSAEVANAAVRFGPAHDTAPGVVALCLGFQTQRWKQCFGALKLIPGESLASPVGGPINDLAARFLAWDDLTQEQADYLRVVLGRTG